MGLFMLEDAGVRTHTTFEHHPIGSRTGTLAKKNDAYTHPQKHLQAEMSGGPFKPTPTRVKKQTAPFPFDII